MSRVVLKIEDVSKQYRLGTTGTGTLSHDFNRWWHRIRGKEDPYSQVGVVNERSVSGGDYVWALKDINMEIKQGEVVGIIGKNGAGKSTLLKLLSKVTSPTQGNIKIKGRMASLLEVGTGFNPEFTGRENVFLNGAILGMTKAEIAQKMDEIVNFSGVAKYIDTPVKRYSSGMKVRLGFAVAAHLDPEILVIDEVLAVGDAEFQRKAINKMKDVSTGNGRTVLFVSHNMTAIRNLCNKVFILENGKVTYSGPVEEGVNNYLKMNTHDTDLSVKEFEHRNSPAYVSKICILNYEQGSLQYFCETQSFSIDFKLNQDIFDLFIGINIEDSQGNILIQSSTDELEDNVMREASGKGSYNIAVKIPGKILKPGRYFIGFSLRGREGKPYHKEERIIGFNIEDTVTFRGIKAQYRIKPLIAPPVCYNLVKR